MEKVIQTKIPEQLQKQADMLIQQGWIADMDNLSYLKPSAGSLSPTGQK